MHYTPNCSIQHGTYSNSLAALCYTILSLSQEGLQVQTTVLEDPCKKKNAILFLARESTNCTSKVSQKSLHWKRGKKVKSMHLSPDIIRLCKVQ